MLELADKMSACDFFCLVRHQRQRGGPQAGMPVPRQRNTTVVAWFSCCGMVSRPCHASDRRSSPSPVQRNIEETYGRLHGVVRKPRHNAGNHHGQGGITVCLDSHRVRYHCQCAMAANADAPERVFHSGASCIVTARPCGRAGGNATTRRSRSWPGCGAGPRRSRGWRRCGRRATGAARRRGWG